MERLIEEKMRSHGQSDAAIRAFLAAYTKLVAGEKGIIPETEIDPVETVQALEDLPAAGGGDVLRETVVIKLNGGLGTSMGLAKAKSLLAVKEGLTFLDLIARQVLHLRKQQPDLQFLLMNSFSTHEDTLKFLEKYPALGLPEDLTFVQSRVPKIDSETLKPIEWEADRALEWCPPGHGDLYASLLGSGKLEALLARGVRFAFISNSDNLGATPSAAILRFMKEKGAPFVMEVTGRTEADRKGGHIARRRGGGLLLREYAQCPPEDMEAFQDTSRHRYFNTNNLWLRLDSLREILEKNGGVFPLPIIRNTKTVNPRESRTPKVVQLETAMGAAVESFDGAIALEVPRSRFAPVKKTEDLMMLRSDACELREDWTLSLSTEREGKPPAVALDDAYKLVHDFERLVKLPPSLLGARSLKVDGPVLFEELVRVRGDVVLQNFTGREKAVPGGTYCDETVQL